MGLSLATAPAEEPISLTEAKAHLRVDHSADDTLITTLITVARTYCENYTNRALITQTWDLFLDDFPVANGNEIKTLQLRGLSGLDHPRFSVIEIPKPPLSSVTYIKYNLDTDGTLTTLANTEYRVETASERGRITPAYGKYWPTVRGETNAVQIRFVAGYGAAAAVPGPIKQAMLLLIGTYYAQRESIYVGMNMQEMPVPYAVPFLLSMYQSWRAC